MGGGGWRQYAPVPPLVESRNYRPSHLRPCGSGRHPLGSLHPMSRADQDLANGRIYDPAWGTSDMFVQSELPSEATVCHLVESHGGMLGDLSTNSLSLAA